MSHASNDGNRVRTGGALLTALLALFVLEARSARAQPAGTAFTYQGRLTDNGAAVTGPFDLQCVLFTASSGGTQVGPTVTLNDVPVASGLFTVNLDFGAGAFSGSVRFLEIGVRPGASTGAYTLLGSRQEIKPAPHTVFAQAAPWAGITGMPAGFADGVDDDSGGDITGVTVGTGLTGGGATGAVSIGLDFAAVAANHNHAGQTWSTTAALALTLSNTGTGSGLIAQATGSTGIGVQGVSQSTTGTSAGVYGVSNSSAGAGVRGLATSTTGPNAIGVEGMTASFNGVAVRGTAITTVGPGVGVYGRVTATSASGSGVVGEVVNGDGVLGSIANTTGFNVGVRGQSFSSQGTGVIGHARATTGPGVGVRGITSSPTGTAGLFDGPVQVNGTLSKSAGSFKIDHPLDPENKFLYHSFVESPDMKNVYDGVVVTGANGLATIELPDWFEALNRDFRYQLTVLDEGDTPGFVQVKVIRKIAGNRFTIRASAPEVEVSWQVTGIRKDTYAEKHRIPVEQDKPAELRGRYIHPADWGLPPERAVDGTPPDPVLPSDKER